MSLGVLLVLSGEIFIRYMSIDQPQAKRDSRFWMSEFGSLIRAMILAHKSMVF